MEQIVKGYRADDALRRSFDALAKRTFGLTFEDWYQNGFWGDDYVPYSVVVDGEVAANVSVNRTDFVLDGVYLFANDTVLDFYPKFGFRRAAEIRYARALEPGGAASAVRVPMRDREAWDRLTAVIRSSAPCGRFSLCGNTGLPLFYVSKFMQDCVYRVAPETYAVAELEDGVLRLHAVYAEKQPAPEAVARAFGGAVRRVQLGFTPLDTTGWEAEAVHEDDTTLFVRGAGFRDFERRGLMFPVLAHA